MTFQQEEELFPTIGANDAFVKEDNTNTKSDVDGPVKKDSDNANEAVKANGKRKVPEKSAEKKVFFSCILITNWQMWRNKCVGWVK